MLWLVLALLTALSDSFKDVFTKRATGHVDEHIVMWGHWLYAIPFLIIAIVMTGIPVLGDKFWIALVVHGCFNVVGIVLTVKALKHGELSEVAPMLAFTPAFLLITSPIILGEFPTTQGLFGVLFIVVGSYTLHLSKFTEGWFAPFKALVKEKGPRYMLITALLYSIAANVDKIGVLNSGPYFWGFSAGVFITILMLPFVLFKAKKQISQVVTKAHYLVFPGLCLAGVIMFQFTALTLTIVPYVIAIKRMSGVFGVFWGKVAFHEEHMKARITGAIIMVAGAALIALA